MTGLTPLPTPPTSSDPASFSSRADAFLLAMQNMVVEINAGAISMAGGTLTTNLGILPGLVGAPGLFISADTNTGLWAPAADTLAWVCGGVEIFRSTNALVTVAQPMTTGKIGINMTPTNDLDITHNQNAQSIMSLLNNNAGGAAQAILALKNGTETLNIGQLGHSWTPSGAFAAGYGYINATTGLLLNAGTGNPIVLAINSAEAGRINSSKQLLMGTTTPTAAAATSNIQGLGAIFALGAGSGVCWEDRSLTVSSAANWYAWYATGGTSFIYNGTSNIASINGTSGAYTALSDTNKKRDFEPSQIGLTEILALKPMLYRIEGDSDDGEKHLWFLAQDVKPIIPQAYVEHVAPSFNSGEINDTFIGLNEKPIIAALVKAVQEMHCTFNSRLNSLEAR